MPSVITSSIPPPRVFFLDYGFSVGAIVLVTESIDNYTNRYNKSIENMYEILRRQKNPNWYQLRRISDGEIVLHLDRMIRLATPVEIVAWKRLQYGNNGTV